jgi:hypothetical protein
MFIFALWVTDMRHEEERQKMRLCDLICQGASHSLPSQQCVFQSTLAAKQIWLALSLPFFSDSRCVYAGARRVTMDANDSLANAIKRACNACMHAHTQYSRHRETEARNVHADRARKPHIYPWPGSRLVGSRRVCAPVPWVISLSVSLHSRVARELILVPNIALLLKQWSRDVKNNQTH